MNLLGEDVYAWYREINSNPDAARRTLAWYTEMAGLRVFRKDAEWQQQAVLPIVGPVVSKTIVVPIESGDDEHIVRVRLESSPMLWNIESVQLATEMTTPMVHEVRIARATDLNGVDVAEQLRNKDGSYYVAMHGDRVSAEFEAPQARPGMTLTVLARTTGHYYARSSDDRKGYPALVSRLMTVSPFSQGYFMLQYQQQKRRATSE